MFFNRVIDDGKASDNTRHLAVSPLSGEAYLLPAAAIRRVVLCSGQIYYTLSRARRAHKIRDVVLVRLEQIAPFPHDLVTKVYA
jgi:2-oxoglutarate dehydrogenase E1 component